MTPLIGMQNVRAGFVMISLGLLGGMLMSAYAFEPIVPVPASLDHYDDLPRRLLRLAHIAAIMLPLLNIVFGLVIDRLYLAVRTKQLASWLLIVGAVGLPITLALEALWAPVRALHIPGVPASAFCVGVFILSTGALKTRRWSTP